MASQKTIRRNARALFKMSFDPATGQLSGERISGILKALEGHQPPSYESLLRAYHRFISAEVARGQARIEHAGPITQEDVSSITASLSKRYGRPITAITTPNPELIAGLRIRVGDDVHDLSVAGTLAAISAAAAA
jgi:F-type H+-transporting ATPase subunit delta